MSDFSQSDNHPRPHPTWLMANTDLSDGGSFPSLGSCRSPRRVSLCSLECSGKGANCFAPPGISKGTLRSLRTEAVLLLLCLAPALGFSLSSLKATAGSILSLSPEMHTPPTGSHIHVVCNQPSQIRIHVHRSSLSSREFLFLSL